MRSLGKLHASLNIPQTHLQRSEDCGPSHWERFCRCNQPTVWKDSSSAVRCCISSVASSWKEVSRSQLKHDMSAEAIFYCFVALLCDMGTPTVGQHNTYYIAFPTSCPRPYVIVPWYFLSMIDIPRSSQSVLCPFQSFSLKGCLVHRVIQLIKMAAALAALAIAGLGALLVGCCLYVTVRNASKP